MNGWTLNTPDTFEGKASTRKLPMTTAFEFDCGLIVGDVSWLVPQSLTRISCFDKNAVSDTSMRHEEYGHSVSDVAMLGEKRVNMNSIESAAIDSMMTMKDRSTKHANNRTTELVATPDDNYILKLSSWITRHLAIFNMTPTEEYCNVSAHVVSGLMEKLDCPLLHVFPSGRSPQLTQLGKLFMPPKRAT
jgi:hypothetical protein